MEVIGLTKSNTKTYSSVNTYRITFMANKPTIGRPRLPKGSVKEVFALRLSPDERKAIEKAAKLAGVRATEWARNAMLGASGFSA